ncbi:MAG: hypothetical protein N3E49_09030 [Bacteroidia bacterium]|nr:hypothetical protein [Bacteroidia bacterium]
MRSGLALLIASLHAQDLYMGSELVLLRFYKGFYPPILAAGAMGGLSRELYRSGESYKLIGWGEAKLFYLIGASRLPLSLGAAAGMAARAEIPSRARYYAQIGLGLDGYTLRFTDGGNNTLTDRQLRPILSVEIGSSTLVDGIFLRYSFYPTPGTTLKSVLTFGSYIGE